MLAVVDGDSGEGAAADGVKVKGTIAAHGRGEKTLVFKFKRKKQYKRTIGHRQNLHARADQRDRLALGRAVSHGT